jgi:adenylate kinase
MALYLLIMGPQGAGKGTQAAFLSHKYGIPHISTGDLFRAMRTREDDFARRVQAIMNSGALIDDQTTNEVVRDRLSQPDAQNGAIFDGYPRTIDQAEWLNTFLEGKGQKLNAALLLEIDFYTAFKRAFGRVSGPDGNAYNIYSNNDGIDWRFEDHPAGEYPPRLVASMNGQLLKRRPDDEAASVIKRLDTYEATTRPLVDYYAARGILHRVDANQPIDTVSEELKAAVDRLR